MSEREINLLSKSEVSDIYDIPDFNDQERELYFSITDAEVVMLAGLLLVPMWRIIPMSRSAIGRIALPPPHPIN